MKHLKIFEGYLEDRQVEKNKFVSYVLRFYGLNGTWGEFFDYKLTQKTVEKYVDNFIKKRGKDFDGDSLDRELYRDFLLVKLGISDINEVETNVKPYFTESELKDAGILHNAIKFNL